MKIASATLLLVSFSSVSAQHGLRATTVFKEKESKCIGKYLTDKMKCIKAKGCEWDEYNYECYEADSEEMIDDYWKDSEEETPKKRAKTLKIKKEKESKCIGKFLRDEVKCMKAKGCEWDEFNYECYEADEEEEVKKVKKEKVSKCISKYLTNKAKCIKAKGCEWDEYNYECYEVDMFDLFFKEV